jgi:helicase MOV-10
MMERIMSLDNYKYDQLYGYNSTFIVQLVENFRSHPSIFEFSNEEFYNSRLVSRQKEETANFAIGWNLLPNKNYPVIFHANTTASARKRGGTSMFNQGELNVVKKYVTALLDDGINGKKVEPSDIGIISPYSAQNKKLKKMFTNGIEIGTVDYFQGREKLVIIFSCVRSQTKTVGFLNNQKRLNVALTRAKALQIIIGNPETLRMDKYWRKLIEMCEQKNAVANENSDTLDDNENDDYDDEEIVPLQNKMTSMLII